MPEWSYAKGPLEWAVNQIIKRPKSDKYAGVPGNEKERIEFWDTLTLQLKHIILKLRERPPASCSHIFRAIIKIHNACAEALQGVIDTQYNELFGIACDMEAESVPAIVRHVLENKRQLIVDGQLYKHEAVSGWGDGGLDVHLLKAGKKAIGPRFGLNRAKIFGHTDEYEKYKNYQLKDPDKLLKACQDEYPASVIIDAVQDYVNGLVKLEDRQKFSDWCRDNAPQEWTKDKIKTLQEKIMPEYLARKKELLEMSSKNIQKEISDHINNKILAKYGVKSVANPENAKLVEAAIDAAIEAVRTKKTKTSLFLQQLIQNENTDAADKGAAKRKLQEDVALLAQRDGYINLQLNILLQSKNIAPIKHPQKKDAVKDAIEKMIQQEYVDSVAIFQTVDSGKISRRGVIDMLINQQILIDSKASSSKAGFFDFLKKKMSW